MDRFKSYYLLVIFDDFNEHLIQEVFEIASQYAVRPYSSEIQNSFIFEASSEAILSQFRERLDYEDFAISIERILR